MRRQTYWNAVVVLLTDALCLGLALLEGVLVLELGSHGGGCGVARVLGVRWVQTGQKGADDVARQRLYGWKREWRRCGGEGNSGKGGARLCASHARAQGSGPATSHLTPHPPTKRIPNQDSAHCCCWRRLHVCQARPASARSDSDVYFGTGIGAGIAVCGGADQSLAQLSTSP